MEVWCHGRTPDEGNRIARTPRRVVLPLATILLLIVAGALIVQRVSSRFAELRNQLRDARSQWKQVIDFQSIFTRSLATVVEVEKAMDLVAHYLCDLIRAESVGIFLVRKDPADNQNKLQGTAFAGAFPPFHRKGEIVLTKTSFLHENLRHERIPFGEGVVGKVASTQRSALVEDTLELAPADRPPREVHTMVAVPMLVENRLVGVICAINCREDGRHFSPEDVRMLENLSYQAALARNLVTIYSERSEQQRILQELDFAQEIQQSLLPPAPPTWGEYRVHAFSRSAREVGGDFFDFIEIDEDRLMVAVADASGKGVPACMLMAMCQSFLRSSVERYAGLESLLSHLNRYLCRDADRSHFVTLALCVIDRANHVCDYACAGHTELLVRTPNAATRVIKPEGPALGLLPDELGVTFETLSFCFRPGTSILIFTDGITEALNESDDEFGLAQLEQLWREQEGDPEEVGDAILREVEAFARGTPQADDQTLVIISRPPGGGAGADGSPTPDEAAKTPPLC